ncbi:monooxygenase [Xylographa trunciseda]|nr:monooxygenase [Xylographa trunciseda]
MSTQAPAQPSSSVHTLILGAGITGLAAASTFHRCAPSSTLLVLDANPSVGGVWATENLYPGLKSNNLLGTYEYSDFPMRGEEYDVKVVEHIPGPVIHEYMERFVDWAGLRDCLKLWTKVLGADEKGSGKGWVVKCLETGENGAERNYGVQCEQLVVATGLTCVPMPIRFAGQETFNAPIVNFADLAKVAKTLVADEIVKHVTIYGGSKATYDCVYMFARAGKQITWVIGRSGHGPTWMAPAHVCLGPVRRWLEKLTTTRFFTWFSPCVWGDVWGEAERGDLQQTGLTDVTGELKKLIPSEGAFWYGSGLGILTYEEDVYGFVRNGKVQAVREAVVGLESGGRVKFADGQVVKTGALMCSSGLRYDSGVPLGPEEKLSGWGVPSTKYTRGQKEEWERLNERADREIVERFPRLATAPVGDSDLLLVNPAVVGINNQGVFEVERRILAVEAMAKRCSSQPGRERRAEIRWSLEWSSISRRWCGRRSPVSGHQSGLEINFPGMNGDATAQRQASERVMYDTALFNRFGKWRGPIGYGARVPDFVFESVSFFDLLLRDLGLQS